MTRDNVQFKPAQRRQRQRDMYSHAPGASLVQALRIALHALGPNPKTAEQLEHWIGRGEQLATNHFSEHISDYGPPVACSSSERKGL